jgi:hypothetical protein
MSAQPYTNRDNMSHEDIANTFPQQRASPGIVLLVQLCYARMTAYNSETTRKKYVRNRFSGLVPDHHQEKRLVGCLRISASGVSSKTGATSTRRKLSLFVEKFMYPLAPTTMFSPEDLVSHKYFFQVLMRSQFAFGYKILSLNKGRVTYA